MLFKTSDNAPHASSCTACRILDVLALISVRQDAQHVHEQQMSVHQAFKCMCNDVVHIWMPHWKRDMQHNASSHDDVSAVVPRYTSYKTCMYN